MATTTEHKTDKHTGLPEVPEGYFWEISFYRESLSRWTSVYVTLKKKRKLWFAEIVASKDQRLVYLNPITQEVTEYTTDEYPELIKKLAEMSLDKQAGYIAAAIKYAAQKKAFKKYSGKYPPKTLEGN